MIVPVRDLHQLSIVEFKAGAHGHKETGQFAFWTATLKSRKGKGIIGRARLTLPPGERFDRIRRSGELHWSLLKDNVAYVRPSSIAEITRWALTHMSDWKYAWRASVGGRIYQL